jgi:hypothetical protein
MEWHEAGLLNKSSSLAATLVVTKFIAVIGKNWVTLSCPSQDLDVQQNHQWRVIKLLSLSREALLKGKAQYG